jgi:hypothetical protein
MYVLLNIRESRLYLFFLLSLQGSFCARYNHCMTFHIKILLFFTRIGIVSILFLIIVLNLGQ